MSMPGFSAQAALYQVSRNYRVASGYHSATTGVQLAMKITCTPWGGGSYKCSWAIGSCEGYTTIWPDGSMEQYEHCGG
jgi:hypothetical protein